jgi:hypothetical protein
MRCWRYAVTTHAAARGGSASSPGGASLDALGRMCVDTATLVVARGGAAPPLGCLIREHRGARARRLAVPALALAARARGRLLARACARHARAHAPGTSLAPIHASIRAR